MLFHYKYVEHTMEKMQTFIDFIFHNVWCKAPIGLGFHPTLFDGDPDLKEVMSEFGFSTKAPERGKAFYKDVKAIYELFALLSPLEIDQFKLWYQGNNEIEKICANDPAAHLVRYADIAVNHKKLADQLGMFFTGLYSQALLDLAALRAKIGDIDDHYQTFMKTNKAGKCPFCGINDLLGEYHSKREAYDHYLPKALYPFNSINFYNLVPACHHCNSSYKTSKDPAYTPKDPARAVNRRAVFYPYATTGHAIEIHVALKHADIDRLTEQDITLDFGPAVVAAEIDTWKDLYGIEERYKLKFCSPDARDWIEQFRILNRRQTYLTSEYIGDIEQADPFANTNFLKIGFVKACRDLGLLDTIEKYD